MGMPHLSTGQHREFINVVRWKAILKIKKKSHQYAPKSSLKYNYSEEQIYKNRGENQADNLDNVQVQSVLF